MNISSITSQTGYQQAQAPRPFQALSAALSSGDLAGAQKAFGQMQAQMQARQTSGIQTSSQDSTDPKFQALSQALQSGDITAAQKAFQAVSAQKSHHHGRHGEGQPQPTQSATGSAAASILQLLSGNSTINLTA